MRRAAFIKLNQERWKAFEKALQEKNPDPDQLADLFIQVTDDLSYANTQYPNSDTVRYLNTLASRIHLTIYRNKKEDSNRFIRFWREELPQLFYRYRRELVYSLIIFLVSVIIGAVSAAHDEQFVRLIMGDQYVDMTLENIQNGEPMGVYGSMAETDMFFAITFNNIMVAFRTFVWGGVIGEMPLFMLLSFGTGFILLRNGIMLGAFQFFFFQHGIIRDSVLTIWIHGTIEILSIIIAGAAGLVAGNSILFPGTYRRIDSFRRGLSDGMKIAIGLVPLFIIAGFLESFVTRQTQMPDLFKLAIILGSLAGMIWYVVIYPIKLIKRHESRPSGT